MKGRGREGERDRGREGGRDGGREEKSAVSQPPNNTRVRAKLGSLSIID